MVIYCKSVHFNGFEDAQKNLSFYEMSSFKEGKAMKLAKESGEEDLRLKHQTAIMVSQSLTPIILFSLANAYIHHNVDKLSRVYPAGSRTDSSNYNPVPLWNAGCQIGTNKSLKPLVSCLVHTSFRCSIFVDLLI